jgi:hypothetical protein
LVGAFAQSTTLFSRQLLSVEIGFEDEAQLYRKPGDDPR